MSDIDIPYIEKAKKALYLEVEASIAEDVDCCFQWAIARIKQLEDGIKTLIQKSEQAQKTANRDNAKSSYYIFVWIIQELKVLEGKYERSLR